jgi:hypothetical protein
MADEKKVTLAKDVVEGLGPDELDAMARLLEKIAEHKKATQEIREEVIASVQVHDGKDLTIFRCKKCNGVHLRHAGYIKAVIPFMKPEGAETRAFETHQVMICISCKASYAFVGDKVFDVSEQIDLEAWKKGEEKLHEATGPGGEC